MSYAPGRDPSSSGTAATEVRREGLVRDGAVPGSKRIPDPRRFVFLEASLAVLGLGDPVLPTWGKVIQDANSKGALFNGYYYWILEPSLLLMIAGLAFAMVGFSLDRIFNPRLREL